MIEPSPSTVWLLKTRRSPKLAALGAPGPAGAQLDELLTIAARVPDHGKLTPWRFILVDGAGAVKLGETAAGALRARDPSAPEVKIEEIRRRFVNVPMTVVVVSSPKEHEKVNRFDQELSAGAVCMTLIVAARGMGYGSMWLTEWLAEDAIIRDALGIATAERIAGFVYIGTTREMREDRPRPEMARIVSRFG